MNRLDRDDFINSSLEKISIDIELDTIELEFYWPKIKSAKVALEGILYFEFKPDFTEEPPWLCLDFAHDEILSLNDITEELLFRKEAPIYEQLNFPIFRLCTGSADFALKVICQSISINETKF